MSDLRTKIAAIQHDIWIHWMRYLFSCCTFDTDGSAIIPVEKVKRWQRQVETNYYSLSEAEQASDLEQADRVLAIISVGEVDLSLTTEQAIALKNFISDHSHRKVDDDIAPIFDQLQSKVGW